MRHFDEKQCDEYGCFTLVESPDGPYVLYEDVKKHIEKLEEGIAQKLADRIEFLRKQKMTYYGAELHLAEYRRICEVYDIGVILGVANRLHELAPRQIEIDYVLGPYKDLLAEDRSDPREAP